MARTREGTGLKTQKHNTTRKEQEIRIQDLSLVDGEGGREPRLVLGSVLWRGTGSSQLRRHQSKARGDSTNSLVSVELESADEELVGSVGNFLAV